MLQLGKLDKGALSTSGDAEYKTLLDHWFSAKKMNTEMVIGNTNGGKLVDGSVYILSRYHYYFRCSESR
jgi:hypothetical protein